MDSFGTVHGENEINIFLLMQKFIELNELSNALLTVRSEMLPFSGNNQNIKLFGVPPNTLP